MGQVRTGIKSSAGKNKGNGSIGHGNRYLARVLGEAAVSAGRTDTFLGARYRHIARSLEKKAIVAAGRSILSSSGTSRQTPTGAGTTWAPTSKTTTSMSAPRSATTSVNSKPSATPSPSNPSRRPHPSAQHHHRHPRVQFARPVTIHFRTRDRESARSQATLPGSSVANCLPHRASSVPS